MILILLFSTLVRATESTPLFKFLESCKAGKSPKQVFVIKQWHLSPATNTFVNQTQKLPQSENQESIYSQLVQWIDEKKVDTVVGEGCEGTIDSKFSTEFNGWNYNSLKKIADSAFYMQVATHIPLKLEARYDDKLESICGDNNELVRSGSLHLSNLRGLVGFYTRIKEFKGQPESLKLYMDGATNVLKIPKSNNPDKVLNQLRSKAEKELAAFQQTLEKRNAKFVQAIDKSSGKNFAIVIGGLHGENLAKQLEAKGLNCVLYEPKGYASQDETVIEDLKKSIH